MRPITTPQMRTSKRSIACVRGALSHGCLRKANWEIGVVTRVQDLPGIADKLSPILYDTLVALDLMPYRELTTPEALKAALQGEERLLIDATERAYHRSHDDATQREHYSGKKNSIR